jgi:2-polyprenyl-3-methyl-5-hydroxy-6-metoxy-1,4-benzoquinol methylase
MVNFKPMNDEILWLIDMLIKKERIKGPFLDAGGGIGDISSHLSDKGLEGTFVDFSKHAIVKARKNLEKTNIKIEQGDMLKIKDKFNLILILDVLEHVPNDKEIVKHLHHILNKGGYLIVSVPIKMKEWESDDDDYGHLRRYGVSEIKNLLRNGHFKIKRSWDYTFPFFWLMRKGYTRVLKPKKRISMHATEKTKISGTKAFNLFNKYLRSKILWYPVWRINHMFRNMFLGHQILILAKKE